MERESIIFYKSWADATLHLPAQERAEILTAIIDYAVYGTKPSALKGTSHAVFTIVKPLIDANNKRYLNGKRGGSKKGVSNNPFGRGGKTTEKLPMVDNLTTDGSLTETTKELPNDKCNTLNAKCNTLNELSNDNNFSVRQANASSALQTKADAERSSRKQKTGERKTANAIIDYYNQRIKERGARLVTCTSRTDRRLQYIMARLDEYGEETVRRMIDKAVESRFLNYEANSAPMSIDWLMRPNNFPKVVDGNYDNRSRARGGNNGSMSEDRYIGMIHTEGENDPSVWEREKEKAKKYKR